MQYCKQCVQSDTRPGIKFDSDGICPACKSYEKRTNIDWSEREKQLNEITAWAKENSNDGFDCIVGVSGGKDSHFQALYARDTLDLKVLLVNCAPDAITNVGKRNLENLVSKGFDLLSFRPNPVVMQEVTKRAFYKYGNPVKPSEYPLYAVSHQAALKFQIPLIVQGENPAETLGLNDLEKGGNAWNIRQHNTLAGCNSSDWVGNEIKLQDLLFYQFPDLGDADIRAIYLGHYVKQWSRKNNTNFAIANGLQGRFGHDPNRTGRLNKYSSVDSDMQIVNQMLKYYKFGFGFVTDEVCYSIRDGDITRDQAIELVKLYDGKCARRYILEFCDYIDITEREFWLVTDHWVNKGLFEKENGKWKPKFEVH